MDGTSFVLAIDSDCQRIVYGNRDLTRVLTEELGYVCILPGHLFKQLTSL
jgi:hypothetical protein